MKTAVSPAERIAETLARHPARHVQAGGRTFSYRESGKGEPIALLHGIASSSASWVPFFAAMPEERLVAWDAPGYGDSTPLTAQTPTAGEYARALRGLLDALQIDRCYVAGHSLGALMAGAFAAAQPERVKALVLLDPAAGYGSAPEESRRKVLESRLAMLRELGPAGMAEQRAAQLLSPDASDEALEWVKHSMRQLDPAGYTQAVHMLAAGRLADDACRYPGQAIVLCGSADTVTPEESCRRIAAALPHAEYRTLPGLGHASYVESPRSVAAEIVQFIATVS